MKPFDPDAAFNSDSLFDTDMLVPAESSAEALSVDGDLDEGCATSHTSGTPSPSTGPRAVDGDRVVLLQPEDVESPAGEYGSSGSQDSSGFQETVAGKAMSKRRAGKVAATAAFADRVTEAAIRNERTEAVLMARAIALAGLPKRPTKKTHLSRTLCLGTQPELWLRVTYATTVETESLPFGEDRFVLAAIQHLAIEQDSPLVLFDRVGQVLKYFGLSETGADIQRLRKRFSRLANLCITLTFAPSEDELNQAPNGDRIFVIKKWALPTRKQLKEGHQNQLLIPGIVDEKVRNASFGVVLGADFWQHLQEPSQRLIAPIELLKLFVDCPTGWDYCLFLLHRCSRAKSVHKVPHEVLMSLFKDGQKEPDRTVIQRLKKYHSMIQTATRGRLKATLEEDGYFKSTGGRPRKRWAVRIFPSQSIVHSGKKLLPFHEKALQSKKG